MRGPCYSDNGCGSGEGEYEESGTEVLRKHSKCGVCGSDGSSYNNPCFVQEASCMRQEQIDIRLIGHCSESNDTGSLEKKDEGIQYLPDVKDASDQREDIYIGNHIPCSESFNGYCIHGKCEFIYFTQKAFCRCESGYTGPHCDKADFSILYVVPSWQKLTHVLTAAIIGAVQIANIVAVQIAIIVAIVGLSFATPLHKSGELILACPWQLVDPVGFQNALKNFSGPEEWNKLTEDWNKSLWRATG
uniref:Tomoregulin-1 n=1 Tax=Sphaerodactylus townsendi TaxID=933632 RepID=A0ACB8G4L2_9SAUR